MCDIDHENMLTDATSIVQIRMEFVVPDGCVGIDDGWMDGCELGCIVGQPLG